MSAKTSRYSISKEVLIPSPEWPEYVDDKSFSQMTAIRTPKPKKYFFWSAPLTGGLLKSQLIAVSLLAWLLIMIYASNLPVKTPISSDLFPLWSFWLIVIYVMSLCISYFFHFYPSIFGIGIAVILQMMSFVFSGYFNLIVLAALDTHGRLDRNDLTRNWGAVLYSTIFVTNGGIFVSSSILIFNSFRDLCGKNYRTSSQNHQRFTNDA